MASRRIAWLMAPPLARRPCRPRRPSGGAFGPVAADVPAPHCAISDRVAAREGFHGRARQSWFDPLAAMRGWRSSLYGDAAYSCFIIQRRILSIAVVDCSWDQVRASTTTGRFPFSYAPIEGCSSSILTRHGVRACVGATPCPREGRRAVDDLHD